MAQPASIRGEDVMVYDLGGEKSKAGETF